MIFLFLLPFYLGVSSYMMFRFFYWMKHCNHRFNWLRFKVPFAVVYLFMALSPVIAFLLPKSAVAIVIRRISTYWIGIMLYSLLYVVLFDPLRLIAKHTKLKNTLLFSRGSVISIGSVVVACAVATCLYGIFNARNIKVNEYSVTVNKSCGSDKHLKAVLVADLHMGYAIGVDHITNMVEKINQQNADIVIIAGDIFDNSYDGMDDFSQVYNIIIGATDRAKITVTGITVTNCKTKTYAEKEEKDSKGTNPIIIVIAVIAGIAIAVVVIVIIMNKKSSEAFDVSTGKFVDKKNLFDEPKNDEDEKK